MSNNELKPTLLPCLRCGGKIHIAGGGPKDRIFPENGERSWYWFCTECGIENIRFPADTREEAIADANRRPSPPASPLKRYASNRDMLELGTMYEVKGPNAPYYLASDVDARDAAYNVPLRALLASRPDSGMREALTPEIEAAAKRVMAGPGVAGIYTPEEMGRGKYQEDGRVCAEFLLASLSAPQEAGADHAPGWASTVWPLLEPGKLPEADEDGMFWHPDLDRWIMDDDDTQKQVAERALRDGWQIRYLDMDLDFDDDSFAATVKSWEPRLEDFGYSLVAKFDTEDGPCAIFARPQWFEPFDSILAFLQANNIDGDHPWETVLRYQRDLADAGSRLRDLYAKADSEIRRLRAAAPLVAPTPPQAAGGSALTALTHFSYMLAQADEWGHEPNSTCEWRIQKSHLQEAVEALQAAALRSGSTAKGEGEGILVDWDMESKDVLGVLDSIYADYSSTFGMTPNAFMGKQMQRVRARLFDWWTTNREAIRAAIVAAPDVPKLRASLIRAYNATGAWCSPNVSNAFLAEVGAEVEAYIRALTPSPSGATEQPKENP